MSAQVRNSVFRNNEASIEALSRTFQGAKSASKVLSTCRGLTKIDTFEKVRIGGHVQFEGTAGVVVGYNKNVVSAALLRGEAPLEGSQATFLERRLTKSQAIEALVSRQSESSSFSTGNDPALALPAPYPEHLEISSIMEKSRGPKQSFGKQLSRYKNKLITGNCLLDLCNFMFWGQSIALLGLPGGGKTTLMRSIAANFQGLTNISEREQDHHAELSAEDLDAKPSEVVVLCTTQNARNYGSEKYTVFAQDAACEHAGEKSWLKMLSAIQYAHLQSKTRAVLLIIDDVLLFGDMANKFGYFTVQQLLSAGIALATSKTQFPLTVITAIDAEDGHYHSAAEASCDISLRLGRGPALIEALRFAHPRILKEKNELEAQADLIASGQLQELVQKYCSVKEEDSPLLLETQASKTETSTSERTSSERLDSSRKILESTSSNSTRRLSPLSQILSKVRSKFSDVGSALILKDKAKSSSNSKDLALPQDNTVIDENLLFQIAAEALMKAQKGEISSERHARLQEVGIHIEDFQIEEANSMVAVRKILNDTMLSFAAETGHLSGVNPGYDSGLKLSWEQQMDRQQNPNSSEVSKNGESFLTNVELAILARACTLYHFVYKPSRFEARQFRRDLFVVLREFCPDILEREFTLEELDRALLRVRYEFDLVRPRL